MIAIISFVTQVIAFKSFQKIIIRLTEFKNLLEQKVPKLHMCIKTCIKAISKLASVQRKTTNESNPLFNWVELKCIKH